MTRYTAQQLAELKANFDRMPVVDLARHLGRSEKSVRKQLRRHRLYKRTLPSRLPVRR
jgi:DNA-binding Lrp family transcriptional regulator